MTFKRGGIHFQTKSSLLEPKFLINHQTRVTVIDMACTSFCLPKVIDVGLGRSGSDGEVADEVRFLAEKAGAPFIAFLSLLFSVFLLRLACAVSVAWQQRQGGSSPNFTHGTLHSSLP